MNLWQLLLCLPELLKLINNLLRSIDEAGKKSAVKEDLKAINEAFKNKDPNLLNDVFSNKLRSSKPPKDGT